MMKHGLVLYSCLFWGVLGFLMPVQAINSGIKIIPSVESPRNYAAYPFSSVASVSMAKGEVEHLQLVLPCNPGDRFAFKSSRFPKGVHVFFRELRLINGYYDALVPVDEEVVSTDYLVCVWATIVCDYAISSGEYTPVISIIGNQLHELKVDLTVYDVEIPACSSIPITVGVENQCIIDGLEESEVDKEKKRWIDFMLSYRMTPVFGTRLAPERWLYDHSFSPWSWNDHRTWKLLDDERYSCYMLPCYSLSQEQLRNMLNRIQKEGKLSKCLFYIWDEPAYMDDYRQIINRVDTIRNIAPEARILTTFFCGPRDGNRKGDLYAVYDYLAGSLDVACTSLAPCRGKENEVQAIREHAPQHMKWWSYICWEPGGLEPNFLLCMKGIQQRSIMWRTWKNKSEGFLYWDTNIYHKRKPFTYITDMPHGDGLLVYPGDVFGVVGPIASARLERWRDGTEEMELLRLVERIKGRPYAESILKSVYHSPLEYVELATNIPFFRKELLNVIEKNK